MIRFIRLPLILFAALTLPVPSTAQVPAAGDALRAFVDGTGPGWRTLTEADFADVNGRPETWQWDGEMVRTTGVPVGVYRTKHLYRNFELVIEWRHLESGGNSGVFVWVPSQALAELSPDELPDYGIEVQMLDHGYSEQYRERTGGRAPSSPRTATSSLWANQPSSRSRRSLQTAAAASRART